MDHRDQNPGAIPPPLPGMVPPGVQMIQVGSPPPQGYPPQGKYDLVPLCVFMTHFLTFITFPV